MKDLEAYCGLFCNEYKFAPQIAFFFDQFRKHRIRHYQLPLDKRDALSVELFNDFVTTMRVNAVAAKLKKRVADWASKPKKNKRSLERFEAQLFRRHGRVTAVRLDLHHHKAIFTPEEIEPVVKAAWEREFYNAVDFFGERRDVQKKAIEGRVSLQEVQRDRKRLFTNIKGKPSLFRNLVGYVWRIECAREAGYHLHVTLFWNGAEVEGDWFYAQEVGNYWNTVITKGRGYFENCNAKRPKYGKSWGLGTVNHWDAEKRQQLRHALEYFCKTNQMVQVLPYAGCHLFGCGFVHRERPARGGRPRSRTGTGRQHAASASIRYP